MASLFTETITGMSTVFTPPSDCANSWTYEAEEFNSIGGGLLIQNMDSTSLDETCFPTDFGGNGRAPSSIQVYSPGACPDGYTTPGQFQDGGTTTAICCPSSFNYASEFSTINFFTDSSVLFMGCVSQFSGTTTVPARGNDTDIEVSGTITMWAQPITVEFQQRDLSLFGSSTSADGSSNPTSGGSFVDTTTLPTPTSDSSETTGSGSQPTQEPQSTGLSTGAKAGIGIGAAAGALALIGGLAFFILKKRRNAAKRSGEPGAYYAQDSKEPYRAPADWERRELDASEAAEYRPELDGGPLPDSQDGRINPRLRQQPGQFSELE